MALSDNSIVDIVELILYLPLIALSIYLGWRHGQNGFLGYFYLVLCCIIHAVADIVSLVASSQPNSTSIASIVLSSVGLSPLLLAISGFLHEAHLLLHRDTASRDKRRSSKNCGRWLWFIQWQIHVVVIVAIVLFIIGGVDVYSGEDISKSLSLRKAGAALLFVGWISLLAYAIYLVWHSSSRPRVAFVKTCSAILVATLLTGVRVVYTLAYVSDTSDASLNPITGQLVYRVILVFLVSVLAVFALIIASIVSLPLLRTNNSPAQRHANSGSNTRLNNYVTVPTKDGTAMRE